jgi:hypothetical protein
MKNRSASQTKLHHPPKRGKAKLRLDYDTVFRDAILRFFSFHKFFEQLPVSAEGSMPRDSDE